MDAISDVTVEPCTSSKYIQPRRIHYKQNGVSKIWDAMKVHDAVTILIFNKTRNVFVFVRQFRPALYISCVKTEVVDGVEKVDTEKYPGSLGLSVELCAGIIDKDLPVMEIAQMEVLEECGYEVPLDCIKKVTECRGGVGTTGSLLHMCYAEVTDAMKVASGGGLATEGELIQVIEMAVEDGRKLIFDETVNRNTSLMFTVLWFFDSVYKSKAVKNVL